MIRLTMLTMVAGVFALLMWVGLGPASAQDEQVNSPATGKPVIDGLSMVGVRLGARVSQIKDADGLENAAFQYQWIIIEGTTEQPISGATRYDYRVASDDLGKRIKVRVSFNDDAGNPEELTSDATPPVVANNPATGSLIIRGTARVGETLTADISSIADVDGMTHELGTKGGGTISTPMNWFVDYDYQGPGGGTRIQDSLLKTLGISPDLVGKVITVKWGFLDDNDGFEAFISAPTSPVTATVPDPPQNLEALTGTAGALQLTWEAPTWDDGSFSEHGAVGNGGSPITGYTVQWKEAADSWDAPADVSQATVTGTSHTITGLTGGVEYSLRVFATNAIGDGQPSGEATGTPVDDATGTPVDATAPELATVTVDGATLTLTYNETLDGASEPAADTFSVTVNDNARTVSAVSVSGSTVTLTLAPAVASGDTLTVSYTAPTDAAASRIQDLFNNASSSFDPRTVTNNTGGTGRSQSSDGAEKLTLSASQPQVNQSLTAALANPDEVSGATVWAWHRSSTGTTAWSAIGGANSASYTPVANDMGYYLRATASYTDGNGQAQSVSVVSRLPVQQTSSTPQQSSGGASRPEAEQPTVPATGNIAVRDGLNPGEAIISWDAVPEATHYRIGYVNMATDYPLAKASGTGNWQQAFIYVDVEAQNFTLTNGRAEYTLRRLEPGARHAFSVLTNGSLYGEPTWPGNPPWQFHEVADRSVACPTASAT